MNNVVLNGVKSPRLSPAERAELLGVMNQFWARKANFLVEIHYEPQLLNRPPRLPGEDFLPLNSAGHRQHIGELVRVERNKLGEWYLTIRDFARDRLDEKPGFTSFKLEGILKFRKILSRPAYALQD